MTRQNRSPSGGSTIVNTLRPYEGGTGQTTAPAALVALDVIALTAVNQPNGVAGLDNSGKLPSSTLPVDKMSVISVEGPTSLVVGAITTYKINNYDMFSTYDVQAVVGASVSRSADTITFTAPNVVGASGFTVNGRSIAINIVAIKPNAPTLSAVDVSGGTNAAALQCTGSAFSMNSGANTHSSSDWQVASDVDFTTIVSQSASDTTNKTSWKSAALALTTTYYARVRYRDNTGAISDWSNVVSLTTKSTYVIGTEESKLSASDKAASDNFGYSVALNTDGSRIVIGAKGFSSSTGKAYVFVRSGTTWTQEAIISPSDPVSGAWFGSCVAISADGSRIAVSAQLLANASFTNAGAVYIFLRTGTTWAQEQKLIASDLAGNSYNFGASFCMAAAGDALFIGATGAGGSSGQVYSYVRTGTAWAYETKVTGTDGAGKGFGISVSCTPDGTRVAVGIGTANVGATSNAGAVDIFTRASAVLTKEQRISAPNPGGSSYFGYSTSMSADGSRILVGEYLGNAGLAYVFSRSGSVWSLEQSFTPSDWATGNQTGWRVSLSNDGLTAVVSSPSATVTGSASAGAANVWTRSGTVWTFSKKLVASDKAASNYFSYGVSISGDGTRIAAGAYGATVSSVASCGATYIER